MDDVDAAERAIWAGRASAYRDSFATMCAQMAGPLLDAARVGRHTGVLDVGCGTGAVCAAAIERDALVSACDAEPSMVAATAMAVPEAITRLGVLPNLPYRDRRFETVVANFVLNHVASPRAALAEMARVLRHSGRLAVTIWPADEAPGRLLLPRAIEAAGVSVAAGVVGSEPHERTVAGMTGLLREAGLEDVGASRVEFDHVTDVDTWWNGAARGVATIGSTIAALSPTDREKVHDAYLMLAREFTDADGALVLPHAALLAWGTKP